MSSKIYKKQKFSLVIILKQYKVEFHLGTTVCLMLNNKFKSNCGKMIRFRKSSTYITTHAVINYCLEKAICHTVLRLSSGQFVQYIA